MLGKKISGYLKRVDPFVMSRPEFKLVETIQG